MSSTVLYRPSTDLPGTCLFDLMTYKMTHIPTKETPTLQLCAALRYRYFIQIITVISIVSVLVQHQRYGLWAFNKQRHR
jgi:hypothetical protein